MISGRKLFSCRIFFLLFITFESLAASADTIPVDIADTIHVVKDISLIGNKITKNRIIYRELTFQPGDTIYEYELQARLKRSEENLFNTSLFNSVHLTYLRDPDGLRIFIIMTERWYIFPLPVFEIAERNFNVWWKDKDYSRIIYGGILNWNNFRGRNEVLAISLRLGYTQRLSFFYSIPAISRDEKTGIAFGYSFSRNHQSNVRTFDNKITYFKDENEFAKEESAGYVIGSYRSTLYETHSVEIGYRNANVLDTVVALNPDFFASGKSSLSYAAFRYFFKSDHRDIAFYPLRGYYFDFEFGKHGFNILGDDINVMFMSAHYRYFIPLSKKFYFGAATGAKYTGRESPPYYLTKGLGYGRDYLRGYEYYVVDGQDFAYLKTNLKFELLPKREIHAKFIPLNKFSTIPYSFYLNLYGETGYVRDRKFSEGNPLVNKMQYSYGAGIDFVTYYDMVFRVEYSLNKLGDTGIFLHFTSPL